MCVSLSFKVLITLTVLVKTFGRTFEGRDPYTAESSPVTDDGVDRDPYNHLMNRKLSGINYLLKL